MIDYKDNIKQKRLWWRIALTAVCVFLLLSSGEQIRLLIDGNLSTFGLSMLLVRLALLVLCIISLVKAIRHNKQLTTTNGTAEK
jgi:TRAP-type C4-dicarboxylate transport system permease small subunit